MSVLIFWFYMCSLFTSVCLIMSFVGNRTPGPQWWMWNRALHHLHSNSFKLVHFQTHDIDCRSVCVCVGGHKLDQACLFFTCVALTVIVYPWAHTRTHGINCHCVPVDTHSFKLALFHTHTYTHTHTRTIDCHRAPVDTHSFNVALFPYTALSVIVCPWTHIRLSLL